MHVDARVIALGGAATPTIFVNPRIVQRSDELRMVPWREVCLTLPEIDGVDLLRDEWVNVDPLAVLGDKSARLAVDDDGVRPVERNRPSAASYRVGAA